jgi:hypothetical protein
MLRLNSRCRRPMLIVTVICLLLFSVGRNGLAQNAQGTLLGCVTDPDVYRVTVEADGFTKENSAVLTPQVEQTLRSEDQYES